MDTFIELFSAELENWFSAHIACCDACFDKYAKNWPGIAASGKFQKRSIPLTCFHSGSELGQVYTEQEFLDICRELGCPKCGQPLEFNIWVYNPHFNISPQLEASFQELTTLATKTPFLVLLNPLAKRVLKEIKKFAGGISARPVTGKLYRARKKGTCHAAEQFLPPPASETCEGRYNHAGRPVLYLANLEATAHAEISSHGEDCPVASLTLELPQKILDLADDSLPSDLLQAITYSALLSAPAKTEGWEKPQYTFSRFVADCAIHSGFTALRYPSVEKPEGFNLVVFPSEGLSWCDVIKVHEINEFHPDQLNQLPK
jgi:RES domain-containing protein